MRRFLADARATSRSRRRCCTRSRAARRRGRSSTHHNALDIDAVPAHRARAVPEAAHRRRLRPGLRARARVPQRGTVDPAQSRVHDARAVRGLRRLLRHDAPHRGADRRRGAQRPSAARPSSGTAPRSTSRRRSQRRTLIDLVREHAGVDVHPSQPVEELRETCDALGVSRGSRRGARASSCSRSTRRRPKRTSRSPRSCATTRARCRRSRARTATTPR